MEDNNKVTIGIETRGFEEAAKDIELIADAIADLPAGVNIKAKGCKIRIETTNIIAPKDDGVSGCAPGGVIPKPEESEKEREFFIPIDKVDEAIMRETLRNVKTMCERHVGLCSGCFLRDENGDCFDKSPLPENWNI